MKQGWEIKKLIDIADYRRGSFPQPYGNKDWYGGEGALPFVQVYDVGKNMRLIDNTRKKISLLAQPKSVFVPKGTVIVSLQGSIGRVAITQYDSYVDRTLAIFTNFKIEIDKKYFALQLRNRFDIEKVTARGTTIKTITKEEFSQFTISIPPLPKQKQIVAILDEVFEKIEKAKANIEKNIENAKELFQSKLNQIFSQTGDGWEERTLGDVCEKTKNINWQDYTNKEFEYVELSSVSRDSLLVTETTTVNKENAPSRAKRIIQKGDVIFATTRPTLKRATIIDLDLDGQICSTGYVVLRPKKNINSDWIFFYLLTSTFMNRMESLQRGASYPAVTDNDVKGSTLSIPITKELEDSIVTTMINLRGSSNELVLQYQQKLSDLDELKKSILQKAFAGELTDKTVEA